MATTDASSLTARASSRRARASSPMLRASWLLLAITVAWLSFQDVGVANQLALSATAVAGLLLMQVCRLSDVFRLLFVALATFLTLRYLAWRLTDTLPDPTGIAFIAGFLLFLAELYGIAMYFFGVFVNIHPIDRKTVPLPDDPELLPSVDIFVPSYNEEEDLLELTLTAAKQIRYPSSKLNVDLLDDGGTEQKRADRDPAKARAAEERHAQLQAMCARIGVGYLTRARNESAKAGNINAALPATSGDLILILDADHVPTQNFLEKTVGHFLKDPKLFLVQTPHFFVNPDPIERNLNTWERMPSENEMFYCVGQKGLDFWNASFFCGSAALIRRRYLEEIGGIQGVSITEDAETALELHARGLNSVYVSEPMIAGLQPETFAGFIGQRTRWAQGMMQIFLLKNPLFKRGLTLPQRISYLSSCTFWLFPLARTIFLFVPLTYLFFGMKIYNASLQEFMAYALGHLICSLLLTNHLFGRVRWPFISELYEMAQSLFLAPALLSVFLKPRAPTFKVTSKAETLEKSFISHLANPLLIMFGLLLAGAAAGVWRYVHFPLEHENLAIVFGWNLLNLIFIGAALGVVRERRQRRQMPRMPRAQNAVVDLGSREIQARLEDVSATGAQVVLDAGES
ncbi:MAG: UDP-forming cellulose synthase catalytic subunit, partial [Geminicoccaceae bacterium]|nr:UDP-forming cellulose synthase catalytic subunit [Geminicoccaceae bacterium]